MANDRTKKVLEVKAATNAPLNVCLTAVKRFPEDMQKAKE